MLVGCQENKDTNPVSYESLNKNLPPQNEVTRGKIQLDNILVDPGLGNNYYQIKGKINFTDEYFKNQHNLNAVKYDINLRLEIDASLLSLSSENGEFSSWNISKESIDKIYVPKEGFIILEKEYQVNGRGNNLTLVCKYLVTTDGVGLESIKLEDRPA